MLCGFIRSGLLGGEHLPQLSLSSDIHWLPCNFLEKGVRGG